MSDDNCCNFCQVEKQGKLQDCSYKKLSESSIPDCCGSCSYAVELDHTEIACGLPDMDLESEESLIGHLYICNEFKRK